MLMCLMSFILNGGVIGYLYNEDLENEDGEAPGSTHQTALGS